MAQLVTFRNLHPSKTVSIQRTSQSDVTIAPGATAQVDLDDALVRAALRRNLTFGRLCPVSFP